jgi:hypothetical protein
MFNSVMATNLQDIQKSMQVALQISMRIRQWISHARLGRKINYIIYRVVLKKFVEVFVICQIDFLKTEICIAV